MSELELSLACSFDDSQSHLQKAHTADCKQRTLLASFEAPLVALWTVSDTYCAASETVFLIESVMLVDPVEAISLSSVAT